MRQGWRHPRNLPTLVNACTPLVIPPSQIPQPVLHAYHSLARPPATPCHPLPPQVPYSTYKIFLYNVDNYFNGQRCPWNRNYSAAIQIFTNPLAMSTIRTQHASLYSQGSGFWRGLEQSLGTVHRSGGMFVSRTASLLSSFPSSFPSRTVSTSSSSGASQLGSSCVPGGTGGAGGTGGTGGVGGAGGGSGRSKVEGEEPLSSGVELLEMLRYGQRGGETR